jgi:O-antigen/teichoic acid export membrane protein
VSAEADLATWGSGIKLVAEVGGRVLSIATTFLIIVWLPVESYGLYAALSGVAVILAELADLGLQGTANRALVARSFSLWAMSKAKLVLTLGLGAFTAGLPLLAGWTAALFAPLLPASWLARPSAGVSWPWLLVPLIAYFTLTGWNEFLGVALRARGFRAQEALMMLAQRALVLCGVALALRRQVGLVDLAWVHVVSLVPPVLFSWILTARAYRGPLEGEEAASPGTRAILKTALPLAVNGGLALVSLRLEVLLVFFFRGAREAGLLGAALKIVESLIAFPSAIAAGAMPFLTQEAMGAGPANGPVRQRTSVTVALLAVPATTGLVLLAPQLTGLLGPGYAASAALLRILAFAVVALFMNVVLFHALIAAGRAGTLPRLTAFRVGIAAILASALIPTLGVVGAAAGFAASEGMLMLLATRACRRAAFDVPVASPLAMAACVSAPMGVALVLAGRGAFASALLGVTVYALTLTAAWFLAPRRFVRALSGRHP